MSTYKKLNKQDAFITTYTAHKSWAVSGSQFNAYNIQIIPSATGSYLNSLQQLYYPTKISGSAPSHSFDYYYQSTLYNSQSRELNSTPFIISLPRNIVGTNIHPGVGMSIYVENAEQIAFVSPNYTVGAYTQFPTQLLTGNTLILLDDGEGNLYESGSNPKKYIGDIIYPHGMIVITDPDYALLLKIAWNPPPGGKNQPPPPVTRKDIVLRWESSQPIFTHNYHCKVRDFEFNYTYNSTATSSSLGAIYDNDANLYSTSGSINKGDLNSNVTGSEFTSYFTTVGLYNDANELIAVAKTTRPVPKSANTEMTIIVKIDI